MDDKLYKKEQEIENLKRKIKEIEQKYKREEKEGTDKKSRELKRRQAEIKDLKQLLKDEEEKRRKAEIIAEEKTSESSVFRGQIEDYKSQIKQLEDNELKLRADLGTSKAKILGLEDNIAKLEANYNELKQQTNVHQFEISKFSNEKDELEMQIRLKNEEIQQKNSEITNLNETIIGLNNNIKEIKLEFQNQIGEKINQFNDTLTQTNLEFNNEISKLQSQLEQNKEESSNVISELKDKIKEQEDELNKNQAYILELETNKEKLEKKVKEKDENLALFDETIETMTKDLQERKLMIDSYEESLARAESGIIENLPNLIKGEDQAIEKLREVANKIKHNAILIIPSIEFLPKILSISDIKPTMKIRIITNIDPNYSAHQTLFNQYYKENIKIRNFEEQTFWGISRDREELVFALNDKSNIPYGFKVEDPFQVDQLGSVFLSIWGKLRKDFQL